MRFDQTDNPPIFEGRYTHAAILPVQPAEADRPFFSVKIPVYNPPTYLPDTLYALLQQNLERHIMDIEVIDNSPNASQAQQVYDIVAALASHNVQYYRQPDLKNVGENWNSCIHRSKGHWVHILHDDDVLSPRFYETYYKALSSPLYQDMGLAYCTSIDIEGSGENNTGRSWRFNTDYLTCLVDENFFSTLIQAPFIACSTIMVRRQVYEDIGGFCEQLFQALDWEMWLRIGQQYPVLYFLQPMLSYRYHNHHNTSQTNIKSGRFFEESLQFQFNLIETVGEPHYTPRLAQTTQGLLDFIPYLEEHSGLDSPFRQTHPETAEKYARIAKNLKHIHAACLGNPKNLHDFRELFLTIGDTNL